jgi:hypothetical protein
MNERIHAECARLRDWMAGWTAEGRAGGPYPEEWEAHLRTCPACALFAEGLGALEAPQVGEALYTPALRASTLAALPPPAKTGMPWWIVPVGASVQAAVSVVFPGLLFDRAFGALVHSPVVLTALTVAGLVGLGALTALAGIVPAGLKLMKEEYHA